MSVCLSVKSKDDNSDYIYLPNGENVTFIERNIALVNSISLGGIDTTLFCNF